MLLLGFSLCLRPTAHKEPWDMRQCQSLTQQGGEVRSHETRGSAGAHHSQEARSRVIGHVAGSEPTSGRKRGLKP
jgi:hypothetical protein